MTDLVDQTILEGSDFTMEIKAIGEIAEYAWFKDGIIVKPCEEFQVSKLGIVNQNKNLEEINFMRLAFFQLKHSDGQRHRKNLA